MLHGEGLLQKPQLRLPAGEALSAYEVAYDTDGGRGRSGRLLEVKKPTLFETSFVPGQMRLFGLAESLGEDGWLKAL